MKRPTRHAAGKSRRDADRPDRRSAPRSPPLRRLLFSLTAVALGCGGALFLAEAALRLCGIKPARYSPPRYWAWDGVVFRPTTPWGDGLIKRPSRLEAAGVVMGEYVPGAKFKLQFDTNPRGYFDRDNCVTMTVNSLGLRGEAAAAEKPAGTYRILGLGDSFAFGEGVKDEDTFLHRLQVQLNSAPPRNRRYQVFNAGVQGYNTRDEVLHLEHQWLEMSPDLVLIVFYLNDAYNDEAILNRGQELAIYREPASGLARFSYAVDLAQHSFHAYRQSRAVEAYYRKHYFSDAARFLENPGAHTVDWTVCRAALTRAGELTRKAGIELGLVIFPELYQLESGYPFSEIHRLVSDTCRQLEIPCLDLLDAFCGQAPETLWVHPSNHHPNENAHALAARAIEVFVREKFLRPGETSLPRSPVVPPDND